MSETTGIRTIWIWLVLVLLALFLLSAGLGPKRSWNPAEQLLIEATAPIQKLIKSTIQTTRNLWLKYFDLADVRDENVRLKREVDALKLENYRYQDLLTTNKRLEKLLQFKSTLNWPALAVQVIGRDPSGWFESIMIDKGKKAGLRMNMPVVNAEGVVGRVVSVSRNYAKVLLIIDQNSAVDCIIKRSREKGIVKGLSAKSCKLDYMVKTSDVVEGDAVITSGLGGVFPKGLPVGEVMEVGSMPGELFKDIKIRPMVDFSKLEELLVILKEYPLLNQ